MNMNEFERLGERVKEHTAWSQPPEECLRCGESYDFRDINLYWDSPNDPAGDTMLGGLCGDCMSDLLDEWGHDTADN